jgi:hypothetical protein
VCAQGERGDLRIVERPRGKRRHLHVEPRCERFRCEVRPVEQHHIRLTIARVAKPADQRMPATVDGDPVARPWRRVRLDARGLAGHARASKPIVPDMLRCDF